MKSNGFRPSYLTLLVVFLAAMSIYFFTKKSLNETEKKLTQTAIENIEKKSPKLKEIIEKNQKAQIESSNESAGVNSASNIGNNFLTRERIYTQEEINNMNEEQFEIMLSDTERRLPKKADIKKLPPAALHHTPALVIEAGRNLGAIKEALKAHEKFEKKVIPFYEKCASDNEGATTVRALCLTNLVMLKKKSGENLDTTNYPAEIVKLSKLVTDM